MKKIGKEHEVLEPLLREIVDCLVYLPDVPMEYKKVLVEKYSEYRNFIGKPLNKTKK